MQHRLIFRVEPRLYEDVFGYLTRVATANHLGGLHVILAEVLKVKTQSAITYSDLFSLSQYCRLHPNEITHLSGISRRFPENVRAWQVCGHWITKECFVATRQAKGCPLCLRDDAYVRGEWLLGFYTVCALNEVDMLNTCQKCRRKIDWNRRDIRYCSCGFDFSESKLQPGSPHGLLLSQIIAQKTDHPYTAITQSGLSSSQYEHLAALSLDGLCKTIWFFGHCLGELGQYGTGHGKLKPQAKDADAIIWKAIDIVQGWPLRLGDYIYSSKQRELSPSRSTLLEKLLGPVQNFFQEELQDSEFAFVRAAYEQHLKVLRKGLGRIHQPRIEEPQLEFDFDS